MGQSIDRCKTLPIYDQNGNVVPGHRMIDPTGAPPEGFRWGPEGVLMSEEEWQRLFGQ